MFPLNLTQDLHHLLGSVNIGKILFDEIKTLPTKYL